MPHVPFTIIFRAWWFALRPLSLVIALVSCGTGLALAFRDGNRDYLTAALIVTAGLLLQSGVNLINDSFEYWNRNLADKIPDLNLPMNREARNRVELFIFISGLGCFFLTIPLGLILVWRTGWPLLLLGIFGMFGGYSYTGEPFNYKRRGLAVVFVFFLMGVFMIAGSYYAQTGAFRWASVAVSLPISALVSHLLLCNELRDYEYDRAHGHRTLTGRLGYRRAVILYFLLLAAAYGGTVALHYLGLHPCPWGVFAALPLLIGPVSRLRRGGIRRKGMIPFMMVHHTLFGTAFIGGLLLSLR